MGPALEVADQRGASRTAVLVRASALALREHPRANSAYRDGHFELYSRVNAGVLLASEEHHEIATVLDADQKTLEELTAEIGDLGRRAGALRAPERAGATFTIAAYPATRPGALIAPPNAIALAAGELRVVATVRDGTVVPGQALSLTLACDHRILYGARAVSFIERIREVLERAAL